MSKGISQQQHRILAFIQRRVEEASDASGQLRRVSVRDVLGELEGVEPERIERWGVGYWHSSRRLRLKATVSPARQRSVQRALQNLKDRGLIVEARSRRGNMTEYTTPAEWQRWDEATGGEEARQARRKVFLESLRKVTRVASANT
jgi:hypothetical protein